MSLLFDINQIPSKAGKTYKYASFVPDSSDPFRVHASIGAAKQSLINRMYGWRRVLGGKILEMVDGKWYILYDVKEGTSRQNLPWIKEVSSYWSGEVTRKTVPMSREEYAEWRIQVDRESR